MRRGSGDDRPARQVRVPDWALHVERCTFRPPARYVIRAVGGAWRGRAIFGDFGSPSSMSSSLAKTQTSPKVAPSGSATRASARSTHEIEARARTGTRPGRESGFSPVLIRAHLCPRRLRLVRAASSTLERRPARSGWRGAPRRGRGRRRRRGRRGGRARSRSRRPTGPAESSPVTSTHTSSGSGPGSTGPATSTPAMRTTVCGAVGLGADEGQAEAARHGRQLEPRLRPSQTPSPAAPKLSGG